MGSHLPLTGDYPPGSELPMHFTELLDGPARRNEFLQQLSTTAEDQGITCLVVSAVLPFAGRVLLLKRRGDDEPSGIWELPAGTVERGERLTEALIRIVLDATGLDVAHVRSYLGSFDYEPDQGQKVRRYNFVAEVVPTDPIRLDSHETYVWAKLNEVETALAADKAALVSYLAGLTR